MSLSTRELESVVGELQALCGGFVQKAHLTSPRSLYLELRQPGASHLLLVCAEPGRTRLHLAGDRPSAPEPPYAFQGLVRAELIGAQLEALELLPTDRVVSLRLRTREGGRRLVAELTGRHGNLFLLGEDDHLRGCAVPTPAGERALRPGQPYQPPTGLAPSRDEAPPRFSAAPGMSLSAQIDLAYSGRERTLAVTERRRLLEQGLKARRTKLARTLGKVEEDCARAGKAEEHRRRGELLKANLRRLERGMREIVLTEYSETGVAEVRVSLDPARSPHENLEREFHQYRRLLAGQVRARARLDQLAQELAALDARVLAVAAMTEDELLAQSVSGGPRAASPGPRRAGPRLPFREYLSPSGQRIRVGRGSQDNDALTFRHSKGNDLWLHARGVPGSHVVVPLGRDEDLKDETLRDAALLAAHFSDARGDAVEVAWTRVKYVRKQEAPGAVTYSQERAFHVRPDPARLALLEATLTAP